MPLRQQYPEGQIAICLEGLKGGLIFHLMGYAFLTIFPVNPKSLARFRETFSPSGAKGDPTDANYLREVVTSYHDILPQWKPDNEQTRVISFLSIDRRKAIADRTRLTNRLRANLKMYFPQAITLAGEKLYKPLALDFLHKWPQLVAVQKAQAVTLQKFYVNHNCRSEEQIEERIALVRSTMPLTTDQAIIKCSMFMTELLIGQLKLIGQSIDKYDTELKILFDNHPDKDIFNSFPGSGDALGPRLLAAWGSNRDRFDSADSMLKYSGIAPVTRASGKSKVVIRRLACPKFILQTFHEFANCSRSCSAWANAHYNMQCNRGKSHNTSVRSLAFKWIRIMYKCWQTKNIYNEAKYLEALIKSKSPLLGFL